MPPEPPLAQINVKAIDGAVVDARELPLTSTTAELKAFVAERTGELATNFSLLLGEVKMDDARSLAEHGIVAGVAEVTMIISGLSLETDKEALIALYNSTNGDQCYYTGCLSHEPRSSFEFKKRCSSLSNCPSSEGMEPARRGHSQFV